mmetsp:Transcript_48474/g.134861  ORF Transcript_48474/g.134861 Transcript_48474/m.134861 type:complete len:236 (+) Transcript_48474:1000-1707(+)
MKKSRPFFDKPKPPLTCRSESFVVQFIQIDFGAARLRIKSISKSHPYIPHRVVSWMSAHCAILQQFVQVCFTGSTGTVQVLQCQRVENIWLAAFPESIQLITDTQNIGVCHVLKIRSENVGKDASRSHGPKNATFRHFPRRLVLDVALCLDVFVAEQHPLIIRVKRGSTYHTVRIKRVYHPSPVIGFESTPSIPIVSAGWKIGRQGTGDDGRRRFFGTGRIAPNIGFKVRARGYD